MGVSSLWLGAVLQAFLLGPGPPWFRAPPGALPGSDPSPKALLGSTLGLFLTPGAQARCSGVLLSLLVLI